MAYTAMSYIFMSCLRSALYSTVAKFLSSEPFWWTGRNNYMEFTKETDSGKESSAPESYLWLVKCAGAR